MPAYLVRAAFRSKHTASGALCLNVLHFELDAFTSPPDYQRAAVDIDAWLGQKWRDMNPSTYTVADLTVTSVDIPGEPLGQGTVFYNFAGSRTVADEDLSKGLCAVANLVTGVPKRWARGRLFAPPALASINASAGGNWNAVDTYLINNLAFYTALLSPHTVGNNTYTTSVFSPTQLALGNAKPWNPVLGISSDGKQHFLRSRVSAP